MTDNELSFTYQYLYNQITELFQRRMAESENAEDDFNTETKYDKAITELDKLINQIRKG